MWALLAIAVFAMAADLLSKILVVSHVSPTDPPIRTLGGAIYILQARNSGAAFSLGTGSTAILTAISLIVAAVIVRAARKLTSSGWAFALGLVLGGAIGNLIDRFFRSPSPGRGHVVDWISLFADDGHVWPIFNLADSAIVLGGAIAVVLSIRGVDFSGGRSGQDEHATSENVAGSQDETPPTESGAHG